MPHFFLGSRPCFGRDRWAIWNLKTSKLGSKTYLCRLTLESMHWFYLILAGLFEVGFTTCLSKARTAIGTEFYLWGGGFLVFLTASMYLLYRSTEAIPMGTAYGVWTGIGACGTALVGILFFKESADIWRLFFIITLIGSVVGLKVVSST